jgi:hypothetical protein
MKRMTEAGLMLALLLLAWISPARADFYDEACQTILLKGKIELPAEFPKEEPLQLTLSYQMNFQQAPSYLVINLPTGAAEFEVPIVGYRKKDPKAYEIPPIFWYPRPVTFRYYVESRDRRWKSVTHQNVWRSAATKVEEAVVCQPEFYLDPLKVVLKGVLSDSKGAEESLPSK